MFSLLNEFSILNAEFVTKISYFVNVAIPRSPYAGWFAGEKSLN